MPSSSIIIVSDGKPGHLNQSRGLALALKTRVPVDEVIEVEAEQVYTARWQQRPLIIATGSKAYGPAISLKRKWKCPAIVLMNPGWWRRWQFNLCIVPRHDQVFESKRVVVTEGALNTVGLEPGSDGDEAENLGVVLVGGPSGHHDWAEERLLEQVNAVFGQGDRGLRWVMTSSRRTPGKTELELQRLADRLDSVTFLPASETPPGWVAEQLLAGSQAWVTEDSVSMVYEALTAGCEVGLLEVPQKPGKPGRVVRGAMSLVERGWVSTFSDWQENGGGSLSPSLLPGAGAGRLDEANRVAGIVLERLQWPAQ